MKSASVKTQPQSFHSIIKSSIATRKERQTKKTTNIVVPPTDETINTLNELGRQQPFCISFKQKRHDPL